VYDRGGSRAIVIEHIAAQSARKKVSMNSRDNFILHL
jgi:hypothetical protein